MEHNNFKVCFLQSIFVAIFLSITFFIANILDSRLLVTSVGSSAFVAFALPKSVYVKTRYLFGGYIIGAVFGILAWNMKEQFEDMDGHITILFVILAVFLTSLVMTYLDFEHPPCIAFTITIVLSEHPYYLTAGAIFMISMLVICRELCKRLIKQHIEE